VDTGKDACVFDGSGKVIARYAVGSFFAGLGRPWMGLHTIDTVRRDAAQHQVWFEAKHIPGGDKAQVVLACDQVELVYTVNMETDVIEKITFSSGNAGEGELTFSYMQDMANIGPEFAQPRVRLNRGSRQDSPGMLWLTKLVQERW
jgi:hypothetical protein